MKSNSLTPALSGSIRDKLIRILGLLGSDQAGERDAAALAATRLMLKNSLAWHDIIVSSQPAIRVPPRIMPWRTTARACLGQVRRLTPWEHRFLTDLCARNQVPSPRQLELLAEIATKVGVVPR